MEDDDMHRHIDIVSIVTNQRYLQSLLTEDAHVKRSLL